MKKMCRLREVLQQESNLLTSVMNKNKINDFINATMDKYEQLENETDIFKMIGKTNLNWSVSITSIYITLKQQVSISSDKALNVVSEIFENTVDQVLNQLSFVQLAFHYAYNPDFLKWIVLNALIADEPLSVLENFKEYDLDKDLKESLSCSNIVNYFNYYEVDELIHTAKKADTIIEKYIKDNFNNEKPQIVYRI